MLLASSGAAFVSILLQRNSAFPHARKKLCLKNILNFGTSPLEKISGYAPVEMEPNIHSQRCWISLQNNFWKKSCKNSIYSIYQSNFGLISNVQISLVKAWIASLSLSLSSLHFFIFLFEFWLDFDEFSSNSSLSLAICLSLANH